MRIQFVSMPCQSLMALSLLRSMSYPCLGYGLQVLTALDLFNWRDTDVGVEYVRFPKVKEEFDRVDSLFRNYVNKVTGVPVHPASYSLTYVNIIKQGEGWSKFDDISDVFPDFAWRGGDRFLPPPSQISCKLDFTLPNGMGNLSAHLQPAKLTKENVPILRFELVATSGSLSGKEISLNDWASVAHEWIVQAFKDLSSPSMHNKFWLIEKEG